MIVVPDLILINSLNNCLQAIREDYQALEIVDKIERSMLNVLFDGLQLGRYDYLSNVVKMIITTDEDPNHIIIKGGYDTTSNKSPFIFVTLASENDRNNSLNIGQGDNQELTYADDPYDQVKLQSSRRWATTYQVVIGGDDKQQVVVLYNLLKAMMIILIPHLDFEGLSNLKIGGQDIRLNTGVPDKIFTRAMTVSFEYEQVVPELQFNDILRKIRLYWRPEGATVAQGPIEFNTIDDLNESSF